MAAFDSAISAASEKYFNSVYGDRQVELWILGTHPDYQSHGIGTRQCKWGMRYAEAHAVPVTVFSSPMGERLYRSLGFRLITHITVQVEGEEEKLSIGVMVFENTPKDWWLCPWSCMMSLRNYTRRLGV
jgi:GNAT superfamily N-acetyltransferase